MFETIKAQDLLNQIKNNEAAHIDTLIDWCQQNSGSTHTEGLNLIRQKVEKAFTPLGVTMEHIHFDPIEMIGLDGQSHSQTIAPCLFMQKRPECNKRVLLVGHIDTVYSPQDPFQKVQILAPDILNGPGVADMKGGILVMLEALKAFESLPCAQALGWDVYINTDEELGSLASALFYERIAAKYEAALVYEPAMDEQGTLAKNRHGSGKFTLIAKGKAAHAGRAFAEGRNAIVYLAQALIKIHQLNDKLKAITLNIGKISGGTALNVVPETAVAQIDVRISESEDANIVLAALKDIQKKLAHPDYSLSIQGNFGRPVKKVCSRTLKLFEKLKAIGEALELNLTWKDSGGCCDGNNLSELGVPVLDTLGVRGGNIHSDKEFMVISSLSERAALSALLLQELACEKTLG